MRTMIRVPFALLLLVAGAITASAQEAPGDEAIVITAENRTAAAETERGEPRVDDAVRAGDELRYTLTFTNPTDGPVRDIVLDNPVPEGLDFVAGSARIDHSEASLEFSIDGGQSFSAEPTIEVIEDGRTVQRPAPPEMYTTIRWTVEGSVQPGEDVIATYDAKMPAEAPDTPATSTDEGRTDG